MRNSPRSSVTALRTFSMRTGLDASTVTPGSTAPDASVTTPEMLAALVFCPAAATGSEATRKTATRTLWTDASARMMHLIANNRSQDWRRMRRDAERSGRREEGEDLQR